MKTCTKCGIKKELKEFHKNKSINDGLFNNCKQCVITRSRTKAVIVTKIYTRQLSSSKDRGHNPPNYNLKQLREWVFSQNNFEELYNNWVKSGYKRDLTPSIDRLDDYKGYSFDNIQLMTWRENYTKAHKDMLNGVNNKQNRAVIGTDIKTGEIIEFHSLAEAKRKTGACHVFCVCKGDYKTSGGYTWKYKD